MFPRTEFRSLCNSPQKMKRQPSALTQSQEYNVKRLKTEHLSSSQEDDNINDYPSRYEAKEEIEWEIYEHFHLRLDCTPRYLKGPKRPKMIRELFPIQSHEGVIILGGLLSYPYVFHTYGIEIYGRRTIEPMIHIAWDEMGKKHNLFFNSFTHSLFL